MPRRMWHMDHGVRKDVLDTVVVRDFTGGWNVVDNDLNLSAEYATVLDNIHRFPDGALGVRYGTRLIAHLDHQTLPSGTIVNPFTTTNGSTVVEVLLNAHGIIPGHTINFSNAIAVGGIVINGGYTVTAVLDADRFEIVHGAAATSDDVGGGNVNYTYGTSYRNSTGNILDVVNFQDRLVVFTDTGQVVEITGAGVARLVFSTAIASRLPGTPAGWSAITFVSTDVFNGQLIACNGIDKPLLIDFNQNIPVTYLMDVATATNANTPIARYTITVNDYTVMAGDPEFPGRIHISAAGTSGTWFGDPAPNDATFVDVGKAASTTNNVIRGLGRFGDLLAILFDNVAILYELGIYDTTDHIPSVARVLENHGGISHRSIMSLGNDMLYCDIVGVPSIARAVFTDAAVPERVSELIDPAIQSVIAPLTIGAQEDYIFAVHNQIDSQYMLFVPNHSDPALATETECFVYTTNKTLRVKAWARFRGWNWQCGCRTVLRRIVLGKGRKLFVLGTRLDPVYADLVGDYDAVWSNNTPYTTGDQVLDSVTGDVYVAQDDHVSPILGTFEDARLADTDLWEQYEGEDIEFEWEWPWGDMGDRMKTKQLRYVGLDTQGTGRFNVELYFDNHDAIQAQMTFVGGDSLGYGGGTQPYGGGRRSSDERLWAIMGKFKIIKIRITGAIKAPLKFIGVALNHVKGSIRR
jgi:hypothetical protein